MNRIRELALDFLDMWKDDYQFKTMTAGAMSALIGLGFTIFNGVHGLLYHSVWNISICIYYILLAAVRGIIVHTIRTENSFPAEQLPRRRIRVFKATHWMLLFIAVALIAPIASMIIGERSYTYGLVPAIAMAAYTCYRLTMGIFHYVKSGKADNILVRELRTINLQDALVAVLTLHNALIIANSGSMASMMTLTAWTSAGIWAMIVFFTIRSLKIYPS